MIGHEARRAPSIFSVTVGPEAQTRVGVLVLRGALLGGVRVYGDGVVTTVEPRVALQLQTDLVLDHNRNSSGVVAGFFAGMDIVPGVGWSAGITLAYAVF